MPYSAGHKQKTRNHIVEKAARAFREKGFKGIGVADLMKAAGLTHGGFYAHFKSKSDLLNDALTEAFDEVVTRLDDAASLESKEKEFAALTDAYLTELHRNTPSRGCAIATLGPEVAREPKKTRKVFEQLLDEEIRMFSRHIHGKSEKAARKEAIGALATMVGTLIMSRVVADEGFSDEIIKAGRDSLK